MTDEEATTLGIVMRNIYHNLKLLTDAERVYQVTMMDGAPHFHSWLVPRRVTDTEKGMKFLARDDSCSDDDAAALAEKLREAMANPSI